MGAAISLRSDFDGAKLRGLARQTRDAAQARRLLALASIYDGGSRADAARLGSVTADFAKSGQRFQQVADKRFAKSRTTDAIESRLPCCCYA